MKQLSRKKIQDMIDLNGANISSRRSSGGSGGAGGGGVSSAWVDEHYVSKDFFARLFTIHSDVVTQEDPHGEVVEPNDLDTDIDNIELMFGSWTEHYLSALGQGSGGGGGGTILTEPLATINESGMGTPSGENKVIVWNGNTWTYMPYTTGSGTVTSVTMTVPTGFKVSNGDTQTINNNGTFALTFGGTITKNQVLASPAAANGTPAWRALVADDIPTLTAAKISDITLTNGTLTIGNNSITPITDATLKSDYSWWGQKLNSSGKVKGDLYMLSTEDGAGLNTDSAKLKFNSYSVDSSDTVRRSPYIQALSGGYGGYGKKRLSVFQSDASDYTSEFNEVMSIIPNGRVGIGTTSPSVLFDVNGYAKTTRLYLSSSVYLEYDSSNSGVHLVGAGLYTDTYVSALGAGSGGGGGSTTLTEPLASINEAGMGSPSETNQVIVYTSSGWSYMPYTTGSGTVTSVGLSMPTGFNVTSTPVTGSGTLTVAFGGSVSKNRVLAAPSDAAGAPSWRKLVAADIPDLSSTYATDARMETVEGYFTDGVANNAARLSTVSKTAWGQTYWTSNGVPDSISGNMSNVGNIAFSASGKNIGGLMYFNTTDSQIKLSSNATVVTYSTDGTNTITPKLFVAGNFDLSGDIVLRNAQDIRLINSPASGETAVAMESMRLSNGNAMYLCRGTGQAGYTTYFYGNNIYFRYGTSGTNGMILNSAGNFGIGTTSPSYKLHVNGYTKTSRLYLSDSVYLEYNSTNSGVHLVGAGLYADTYLSALGAGSGGGGGASDYIPISGSSSITGSLTPSTRNTYDLGSATNAWNTLYVNSISGNASLSVQGVSCTTFSTSARAVISSGAKFASICVESDSSGSVSSSRVGEINRYNGSLHLQYDSGTGNVTMCRQGFVFSTYTDGGGNNLSVIDTVNRSLRIELGSSSLNPYISKPWNEGSDIRLKNIVKTIGDFDILEIANAPVFDFTYKNDDAKIIYLGTSAQYWQKVMPSAVKEMGDGYLSMNYGGTALAAAVLTARKVVNHEKRIRELENRLKISEAENMELRKEIELLKAA